MDYKLNNNTMSMFNFPEFNNNLLCKRTSLFLENTHVSISE